MPTPTWLPREQTRSTGSIFKKEISKRFGDASGLDIADSGKFCIVSGNGYKARLKGVDAVDLIAAMESIFV